LKKPYIISIIFLSLITATVCGCISSKMFSYPGYMISIEIKNISTRNVGIMEKIIKEIGFNIVEERNKTERCDLYSMKIGLDNQLKHPYIRTVVCYSKGESADIVNDFRILIINAWEGNAPLLKEKIDSIGDFLLVELKNTVGDNNIIIERKTTGPPF